MSSENIGLSRFAQLTLAGTALAPVLLVWAASIYGTHLLNALAAVVVAVLLVVICLCTLALARRELQVEPVGIRKATRLDKDALAFLVTYALPLIASGEDKTNFAALAVFVVVLGLVLVQLQILHVNPLLGMLGFHFYEIERADGDSAVAVSRSRHLPTSAEQGRRLGPALWLLVSTPKTPR
jgi:hypothetical protein